MKAKWFNILLVLSMLIVSMAPVGGVFAAVGGGGGGNSADSFTTGQN